MIKRVTWFLSGVVAGITGVAYGYKQVRAKAETLKPVNVAKGVAGQVRARVDDVRDAVREGRDAMRSRETELRGDLGLREKASEIVSVEPGRVVVLRSYRDRRPGRKRA